MEVRGRKSGKGSLKLNKEGAMMSLVQYDEIYEICCEMLEEEKAIVKAKPAIERLDLVKVASPSSNRRWESAEDILHEKERELFYV
ncbi:hypothetical protein JMM81_22050 [Bacillus sp. V3B]|uniref:hypothetical protein n=1 Tax=Bacillus sp. V3B TaxID=2804915 RepID=UPI00210E3661|nr:hypothetical protein [Bacillus sp. V3B]MCQ6277543.1 hypothetical protein [Bacillus sp. V3B]